MPRNGEHHLMACPLLRRTPAAGTRILTWRRSLPWWWIPCPRTSLRLPRSGRGEMAVLAAAFFGLDGQRGRRLGWHACMPEGPGRAKSGVACGRCHLSPWEQLDRGLRACFSLEATGVHPLEPLPCCGNGAAAEGDRGRRRVAPDEVPARPSAASGLTQLCGPPACLPGLTSPPPPRARGLGRDTWCWNGRWPSSSGWPSMRPASRKSTSSWASPTTCLCCHRRCGQPRPSPRPSPFSTSRQRKTRR